MPFFFHQIHFFFIRSTKLLGGAESIAWMKKNDEKNWIEEVR
jgi:hypothetical protein